MLFMTIFTYEPAQRDEVQKRAATQGTMIPKGAKEVGVWSALGGGRVFRVLEVDDPNIMFQATRAWSDVGKIEVVPVMDTGEVLRMLREG
jgi:hypothetical protein